MADCNITEVFFAERERMCKACGNTCWVGCCVHSENIWKYKDAIKEVQKWSDAHPKKTRQSELLELFPNAQIRDGFVLICPCMIDTRWKCTRATGSVLGCLECQKEYWLAEVE